MELTLIRKEFTNDSTISELFVDGKFESYAIEDKDRGLDYKMGLGQIAAVKVHARTAIPYGRYRVVISFSNRFKKYLPELIDVPGYAGVRIHPGNTSADTEGCILPGSTKAPNFVGNSVKAFSALFTKLKAVEKKEKIYITIKKE